MLPATGATTGDAFIALFATRYLIDLVKIFYVKYGGLSSGIFPRYFEGLRA